MDSMRVCVACGAIGPTEKSQCTGCGGSLSNAAQAEARPDGVMFAMVLESDFQCRSCGLRSTLDSLYLDPEIDCHRCGTSQAFDVSQWKDSLGHAHAVADLSGPPKEGQGFQRHGQAMKGSNPFAALGVGFTFAELTQSGLTISAAGMVQRTLRVKVATGHPVCSAGHGPSVVEIDGAGNTSVSCKACASVATYALPSKATELSSGCCGVVDDEHRKDRPVVRMQASAGGGAVALTCPNCSASLPATQDSSVVTCEYCKTVSYLPKRAFLKLNPQHKSRPFWLLFRGPSSKRSGKSDDDDDEDEKKKPLQVDPPSPAPAPTPAFPDPAPPAMAAARTGSPVGLMIGISMALLVLGAGVAFLMFHSSQRPKAASPTPPPHAAPPHHNTPHH
jgi:hypothetical protein